MIRKIAVTGPESTGKSILTSQLADHYNTIWVPEYAREYLTDLGKPYQEPDLLRIAKGQVRAEEKLASSASRFLFCDTELIVIRIWGQVRYGRTDPWIEKKIRTRKYDFYLLCDIDLPWEFDPLREHPHARKYLFDLYFQDLQARGFPFSVVSGVNEHRLANAIRIVEAHFNS